MNIYLWDDLSVFTDNPLISEAQCVMYHGDASRCGKRAPFDANAALRNDIRAPLHLVHSAQVLPDVFRPSRNLIVSESVKKAVEALPNLGFLQVVIDRLVDFYFEKGDFSYYDVYGGANYLNPFTYLWNLPHTAGAEFGVGPFFEVLLSSNEELASEFPDATSIEVEIGPTEFDDPVKCKVSRDMLERYPLQKANRGWLSSEEAHSLIRPFVDWDYFVLHETTAP